MDLNIVGFGYLFLRLAPFVLASFFTLASIFNQDFKGFIYLVGLLFSSFITMLSSKLPIINKLQRPDNSPEICNVLTMGQTDNLSDLPLGQSALAYTFAYLMFSILKYKMVLQNIPTLVFFPLLILFDFIWNLNNSCYSFFQLLTSLSVGAIIGMIWAYIISSSNTPALLYFSSLSNKEVCSKPSKNTFRCNVYKNGKLISKNISG
jgi:multisubunit Na+/H+ antiporter MnhE subunit